jgi:hypothetical protein
MLLFVSIFAQKRTNENDIDIVVPGTDEDWSKSQYKPQFGSEIPLNYSLANPKRTFYFKYFRSYEY